MAGVDTPHRGALACAFCEAGEHERCDGTFTVVYRVAPGGSEQVSTGRCSCQHRRLADAPCSHTGCHNRPVGFLDGPDGEPLPGCALHATRPLP